MPKVGILVTVMLAEPFVHQIRLAHEVQLHPLTASGYHLVVAVAARQVVAEAGAAVEAGSCAVSVAALLQRMS